MPDLAGGIAAAVLWSVAIWRIDKVRRPGAERSLWFVLAMFACAITLQMTWPWQLVTSAFGSARATACIWTCCAILAAAGARSLVVHIRAGQERVAWPRLHLSLAAAALVAVTFSYILAPESNTLSGDAGRSLSQRAPFYAGTVESAVRWAIWLSFLTWALTGMAHVTSQYAGHAERATPGRLRTGLRFGTLGCRVGYSYVVLKVVVVAAWIAGVGPALLPLDELADATALVSITLITIGSTHDALVARRRRLALAISRLRGLRGLRELWEVLYRAAPHSAGRLSTAGIRSRLSRRAIEIRDRQLALRPYVGPDVPRRALLTARQAGYRGQHAQVVAEAAWLEAARLSKARGLTPVASSPYDPTYEVSGGQDLDEEVEWLLRVADAHRRCPLVHTFAREHLSRATAYPPQRQPS